MGIRGSPSDAIYRNWVIRKADADCFWSGEYGWTDINLATRYLSTETPNAIHRDELGENMIWMFDPSELV